MTEQRLQQLNDDLAYIKELEQNLAELRRLHDEISDGTEPLLEVCLQTKSIYNAEAWNSAHKLNFDRVRTLHFLDNTIKAYETNLRLFRNSFEAQ